MSKMPTTVFGEIPKLKEKFLMQDDGGRLKFETECLFAKQQLQKNSYTMQAAQAKPAALQNAILNVAAIGISLNPASAHAYLVPRSPGSGQAPEICLDISYRGLVKLATECGAIQWAKAVLVYEGDTFKWRGPSEAPLHEVEDVFAPDRVDANDPLKNLRGGYCIAKLSDDTVMVEVMSAAEICAVRDSSKAKNGPWQGKWAGEMAKKTLVKRASKSWPQTDRSRFETAVHVLNQHEGLEIEEGMMSADEETIHTFMDIVAKKDPTKLMAHLATLSEQEQTDCFNAAPKGEKTKLKEIVRDLTKAANTFLDDVCTQLTELAENEDPAVLDVWDELDEHEIPLVEARISDITHRQLKSLRESAEVAA